MEVETTQTAIADAVDDKGRTIAGKAVAWDSSNKTVATVDQSSGVITAAPNKPGTTFISATVDGVTQRELVRIVLDLDQGVRGNGQVPAPLADQAAEAGQAAAAQAGGSRRRSGQAKGNS
jgi:hypothetical protein